MKSLTFFTDLYLSRAADTISIEFFIVEHSCGFDSATDDWNLSSFVPESTVGNGSKSIISPVIAITTTKNPRHAK